MAKQQSAPAQRWPTATTIYLDRHAKKKKLAGKLAGTLTQNFAAIRL
ncbi:hypothetical protein [Marinagarivorans algicola]